MSITIDIHALQTISPSCLNRDGSNSPKTAVFGGARRMRVSSQSWKRAMRDYSINHFNRADYGTRTLNVVPKIAELLIDKGAETDYDDAVSTVKKALRDAGIKFAYAKKKENGKTKDEESDKLDALFFIGNRQAERIADDIARPDEGFEGGDKAKARNKAIREDITAGNSIDVSLYGRMLAHQPELNLEAAAEVGHAIGVSPVQTEFDYYSAVDDFSMEDHAGGAMLGDIEYDSGVLYRYANLNLAILNDNLGGNKEMVTRAVHEFIDSFIQSMPTGRQKSFAAETLPETVIVDIHDGRPRSLAGAFEKPVDPDNGIMGPALERLTDYLHRVDESYGFDGKRIVMSLSGDLGDILQGDGAERATTIAELEDKVTDAAMAGSGNGGAA